MSHRTGVHWPLARGHNILCKNGAFILDYSISVINESLRASISHYKGQSFISAFSLSLYLVLQFFSFCLHPQITHEGRGDLEAIWIQCLTSYWPPSAKPPTQSLDLLNCKIEVTPRWPQRFPGDSKKPGIVTAWVWVSGVHLALLVAGMTVLRPVQPSASWKVSWSYLCSQSFLLHLPFSYP